MLKVSISSYLFISVIAILLNSCNSYDLVFPDKTARMVAPKADWTPEEKMFFNPENYKTILNNNNEISPRTDLMDPMIVSVFNKLVEQNEVDSFVYQVARRIGYPLWYKAAIEDNLDSLPEIVYIPFAQRDSTNIAGYLIGYQDSHDLNGEVKIDVQTRYELRHMAQGVFQMNTNTVHDVLRLKALDSLVYEIHDHEFDSLLAWALYAEQLGSAAQVIAPRNCESEEAILCYWEGDFEGSGSYWDDLAPNFLGLVYNGFPQNVLLYINVTLSQVYGLYNNYLQFIAGNGVINSTFNNCN